MVLGYIRHSDVPDGHGRWVCWREHPRFMSWGLSAETAPRAHETFGAYALDVLTHNQVLARFVAKVGFLDVPTKTDGGLMAWRLDFWNSWLGREIRKADRAAECRRQARENLERHREAAASR